MTITEQHNPLLDIDLPKWPGIVVVGDPVTAEQAAEIIIRTGHWPMWVNDKAWVRTVNEIVGLKDDDNMGSGPEAWKEHWRERQEWYERHGILSLTFIRNSQVGSPSLSGAHGWCHWNGFIGYEGHCIGKWPSASKVLEDWQTIAAAFPFLKLRCQLVVADDDPVRCAVIQYNVVGGTVDVVPPETIGPVGPPGPSLDAQMLGLFTNPMRERGCTPETLKRAIEIVRARK